MAYSRCPQFDVVQFVLPKKQNKQHSVCSMTGCTRSPPPGILEGHTHKTNTITVTILIDKPLNLLAEHPASHALGPAHRTPALPSDGVVDALPTEDVAAVCDGDGRHLGQRAEADVAVGVGRVSGVGHVGVEGGRADCGFYLAVRAHVLHVGDALEAVRVVQLLAVGGAIRW